MEALQKAFIKFTDEEKRAYAKTVNVLEKFSLDLYHDYDDSPSITQLLNDTDSLLSHLKSYLIRYDKEN